MKTYKIRIIETLSRDVEIQANDIDDAFDEIEHKYQSGEIVLDADDFQGVEFIKVSVS
jgi:hypothetical protein